MNSVTRHARGIASVQNSLKLCVAQGQSIVTRRMISSSMSVLQGNSLGFPDVAQAETPSLSEDDLQNLLHDLLATPEPETTPTRNLSEKLRSSIASPPRPHATIEALEKLHQRLNIPSADETGPSSSETLENPGSSAKVLSLSERLAQRIGGSRLPGGSVPRGPAQVTDYHKILERLQAAIATAEQGYASSSKATASNLRVSLGLASDQEWIDLVQACLQASDHQSAQKALELAERSGSRAIQTLRDTLLLGLVSAGDEEAVKQFMNHLKTLGAQPTDIQRHLHVKVYLDAHQHAKAQEIVHAYEAQNLPPPEGTYIAFIRSLLSLSASPMASRHRALAWDMFAHMRYVAYPTPSAEMYATMIRACADAAVPSAERALDLFTEMTVDNKIIPTRDAYNGAILTCARSSNKQYATEAFRLGKELVDSYRNATTPEAREALRPTKETFYALLESAKRTGDLARARWILAEILRAGEEVDDRIMANVFQTYASYKPPFQRGSIVGAQAAQTAPLATRDQDEPHIPSIPIPFESNTPNHLPQSHSEVVREAQMLFLRITDSYDQRRTLEAPILRTGPSDPAFANINISTHLLNSYLAVHYNHSSLNSAISLFSELFASTRFGGVKRNSQSFDDVLNRLANTRDLYERREAQRLATPIWKDWLALCDSMRLTLSGFSRLLSPRRIEKVWANMIRILTLSGDLQEALALVRQFTTRYPPDALLPSPIKPTTPPASDGSGTQDSGLLVPGQLNQATTAPLLPSTSSRISLEGRRPLVRLTSNHEVRMEPIPPFFAFKDIELLHHRLVSDCTAHPERKKQISYLTYVIRSYSGVLKKRQDTELGRAGKKQVPEVGEP